MLACIVPGVGLRGGGVEECAVPSQVPAWKQLQLLKVSQLEFQVFQGLRQAGHELGAGGRLEPALQILQGELFQQDLKGWLKLMKQMYPNSNVNATRNKQQLLEEASRVIQQQHAAAAAAAQQLLDQFDHHEEAISFLQLLQAALGGQQGSVASARGSSSSLRRRATDFCNYYN
eukprot:1143186-Pelagomonas_calceolata.AAC.3